MAYRFKLQKVKCITTEDSTGADETRIRVYCDGALVDTLRKDMNDGTEYPVNKEYAYQANVQIEVYDLDGDHWYDRDDHIGTNTYAAVATALTTSEISGDGAHYQVLYSVEGPPPPSQRQQIDAVVHESWGSATSPWVNLRTAQAEANVKQQVLDRIDSPGLVDQDNRSLCGPCSIIHELAKRQPLRYVTAMRTLYKEGRLICGTYSAEAGSQLVNGIIPTGIPVADWMLAAVMRDNENLIADVDPDEGGAAEGISGLTYIGAMCTWARQMLGLAHVSSETTYLWGEEDAITAGQDAINRGGTAFMLVSAGLWRHDPGWYPDHWSVLRGNLVITRGDPCTWDSDTYDFDYFNPNHNPKPSEGHFRGSEGEFEDGFYGCVWGY